MPEVQELLWEVGCEELPAWACEQLAAQVPTLISNELVAERLVSGSDAPAPEVFVGPRRFAVRVPGVLADQVAVREEKRGPAERAAFADGVPTKACEGFARSLGMTPDQLELRDGFVWGVRDLPSQPFESVWPAIAGRVLNGVNFAKPMRWGASPHRFVRPVRWIVTLLGNSPVAYELWGVHSARTSRTHRFLGDVRVRDIDSAATYVADLAAGSVVVDQQQRRATIESGLDAAARALGGSWEDPGAVLNEVVHLVEYPTVITGRFDESYLALPERVLVTAMQSHQRYLPVRRADGTLAPAFLAVMNGDPSAVDSILPGYERVIAGRLDDAVFSFERDRERGLDDMASSLDAVVFHAQAGTLAQRVERIRAVAAEVGRQLGVDAQLVDDAARLAKADQVSYVVQEFAELEGFAGSLYADAAGYDAQVVTAVDHQFRPRSATAQLPDVGVASVIALADKFELLATMFSIGEQPTGSRDPHGLRRAAIGIMRIVLEHDCAVDVDSVLRVACDIVERQGIAQPDVAVLDALRSFIDDRIEKQLVDDGIRVDAVRAARGTRMPRMQHVDALARALDAAVRADDPAFRQVLEAVVRCVRILEKAGDSSAAPDVSVELFESDAERALADRLMEVRDDIHSAVMDRNFSDAVAFAASLGSSVTAFFDRDHGVMVMADDPAVRANRLALVTSVVDVTAPLGVLSELQV